jgi:hypothetical protein
MSAICKVEPRLTQARVVVDAALRRVGDAAVASQQVDVGEGCLRVGCDQRTGLRQPIGHVLGDDDVAGLRVAQLGAALADEQQAPSRDALAVDRHGARRNQIAVVHDAIVVRQSSLDHLLGDRLVLRRSHHPFQRVADLVRQNGREPIEELGDDRRGDRVGVLQLDQPVVGSPGLRIGKAHQRADAERARIAVERQVVEARCVQPLIDERQVQRQ